MTDSSTYRTNRDLFSNHYLDDHLRETEPWSEVSEADVEAAYEEITSLWAEKRGRVDDYNEAQLEKNFIRPVFDILGIPFEIEETVMRNARRPDYGFFPSTEAADAAFDREDFYAEATAVADAKRWGRKLDTRGKEKRDFENPSYQIHRYLQETPAQWAVLTNGELWRLYYGPTSHRLDSYYEIDLPELLDVVDSEGDFEAFKEFYLFFRQEAFLPDKTGDCFLDDVYDESSIFAEELGEDLQENIYEAIRVLAEGFLDTNDELDEDDLELIHDSSLIYLYRLIFVLYAESEGRDLLPTNNEIYSGSYSLNELKLEVVENRDATQQHYQTWQTDLWDQLKELFVLIDEGSRGKGIPKDDLYIPAYNGGLFRTSPDADDSVESQFLSTHEVGDAYLAEVIELLTRHEADEGKGKVFVDYSSLDERNLGSIYEGLLEYKLDVADEPLTVNGGEYTPAGKDDDITVKADEVYLRTDDGERKATGSYYTPEYVVEYIVDETLGPLVDEIREDLMSQSADTTHSREGGFADKFAERIFDLAVLDPAMGSGHFPVNAVDYLARKIIDAQEKQDRQAMDATDAEVRAPTTEDGELRDINWARRKVAQRCIYGVDVNPLATELAKVSLWLRTLAAEQPLAFLDHHLKTGNSLVGSDIEDVLSNGDDDATEDGQLTLQQSFDHTRQRAMEHVTDRFQDLLNIDNETLEDAKEMEAVYDDVRSDPLYKKLLAMANVHTADAFGLDVPEDADERMARALHSDAWESIEEQDWFSSAQAMAEEERFFHWQLEFPMAFYDQDGKRKTDAGFDAVIGNPPYIPTEQLPDRDREYLARVFGEILHRKYDSSIAFLQQSFQFSKLGKGFVGMITPVVWETGENYEPFRRHNFISGDIGLQTIINLPFDIFEGAYVDTNIAIFSPGNKNSEFSAREFDKHEDLQRSNPLKQGHVDIPIEYLESDPGCKIYFDKEYYELIQRFDQERFGRLGDFTDACQGIVASFYDYSDSKESESYLPYRDADVYRYEFTTTKEQYIDFSGNDSLRRYYTQPRILVRRIVNRDDRLMATYVEEEFVTKKDLNPFITESDRYSLKYLLASLNSSLHSYLYIMSSALATKDDFRQTTLSELRALPIRKVPFDSDGEADMTRISEFLDQYQEFINSDRSKPAPPDQLITSHEVLTDLVDSLMKLRDQRKRFNLELLDYLGNYEEGPTLPDVGIFQPASPEYLNATAEDYENLRMGNIRTKQNNESVIIEATARYKPEDEEEFETDTYGYTETDFFKAFTLTNLSEKEAALVKAFVPVAVEEEIGGFRDNATKTNSLIDRLKGMTLPDPDDVADDLRRYVETKERADELDEKIEKTDQLIDDIVYDLYDLTDEEIEIVEEAVEGT
jgi:type II restriction/modification system DNA methylase subunit YeeA